LDRKNRLSPPLMHAFRGAHEARDAKKKLDLRDEAGERVIAGRRAVGRAVTEPVLRREVVRDLENLMNAINFESSTDLSNRDYVRKSIVNHGFPDLARRSIDEVSLDSEVRQDIRTALKQFEPRLVNDTIDVARDESIDPTELKVRFIVRADLSCEPLNVPVEFVADLEFDTGKIVIKRR
jgi:type VI secretion system protein ImpF